jgi:siroheme synthase-like protein
MTEDSSPGLRFLPVGLRVQGKNCLVVGGGAVGTRKALTLLRAGAVVTVLSRTVTRELAREIQGGRVRWWKDSFRDEHLAGVFLAVAATNDGAVNAAVVRACARHGALVCDASCAERCGVIFGALLEADRFTVAVFTGGRDPARARRTRDRIADCLAHERPPKPQP